MTNIALMTDSHFGARNFKKSTFEGMMLFFEKQFFPYLIENNIKDVIHCGDVVHNRHLIDLWFHWQIKERFMDFFEDNAINLHVLIGNHDTYYKTTNDCNYLSDNFREYNYVHIYDKQEKKQIGKYTFLMVPWVVNPEEFKFNYTGCDICAGHFDMHGFKMTKTQFSEEGFNLKEFSRFKQVFSGHYHIKSEQKNVQYIGCPYPLSWNDYDEQHGFIVLKDNFKYKFIDNNVNAKFIKVYYNEINGVQDIRVGGIHRGKRIIKTKEEIVKISKQNYVRIITKNIQNQVLFDNFYLSISSVSRDNFTIEVIDSNEIIESVDGDLLAKIEEELEKNGSEDLEKLFGLFLNSMAFEEGIDKKLLMKLFEEMRNRARELGSEDASL